MAGDKNCNFTLCKTSRIGTFHKVVHDVCSFSKQKPKQTVEPAQYELEINLNASNYLSKISKGRVKQNHRLNHFHFVEPNV